MAARPPPEQPSPSIFLEVLAAASAGALASLPDSVPTDLRTICQRALAARPADRYPDVPALREALEAFLAHRESRRIAAAARTQLEECRQEATRQRARAASDRARNQLYASFAEVVAGFRQALVLWERNPDAAAGERAARLAYAETASRCGDLGLAEAQLEDLEDATPEAAALRRRITSAKLARKRAARTGRRLRRGLVGAVVTIVCGLAVGVALVNRARENAVNALARERTAKTQLARSFHDQGVQALLRHEALSAELLLARALTLDDRLATRERLLEARGKGVALVRVLAAKGSALLTHVAYSPDGRRLAAAATDGTIRFWDGETGRELSGVRGTPYTIGVRGTPYTIAAWSSGDTIHNCWSFEFSMVSPELPKDPTPAISRNFRPVI